MIMILGIRWIASKLSTTVIEIDVLNFQLKIFNLIAKLFDILGKLLDEYLIILSITFFRTHHFLVGLKFMWSGNNYKNNKF